MTPVVPPATDLVLDLLTAVDGGRLSVQDLGRAGAILGVGEGQMRVALTRLVQQQKLCKAERGLYGFHSAYQPMAEDVIGWLGRVSWMTPWAGDWVAVVDPRIPTTDRTRLRRHQRALSLRGFRTWRPGFHLRPANLVGRAESLRLQLPQLGLAEGAEVIGVERLDAVQHTEVQALWAIDALRANYRRLIQALVESEPRLDQFAPEAAARESLLLGRAVIAEIMHDPLLPSELIGGGELLELVERMRLYQERGRRIWSHVLGQGAAR
ncbi:PaaX family transcriptional regulator [Caulobacter sp.]|uniref:PaaX family transcriptional regulator n=1 Tax=Caulobacter sp. TaxID=78 RepID=UPI001622E745